MNYVAALTELVIFARERGIGEESIELACRVVERKVGTLRAARICAEKRRRRGSCAGCERRSSEMLCVRCSAEAPPAVRRAFQMASGLDGMREACRVVRGFARGDENRRAA